MGDHIEGLTEIQMDVAHSSFLVYCCGHSITEGHEIGKAGLALGKAVLAVLNYSLSSMCHSRASGRICSIIFPGLDFQEQHDLKVPPKPISLP